MPSEHIARLKATYENGEDNIGKDFIRPCLKECIAYRRGTAFFSSSSLKAYADALNHIVEDKVRIEILCSPVITDEGLLRTLNDNLSEEERLNTIQKYQEHFILKVITKFKEDPDNRSRERSALLAYLIANDLLVIKTAIRKSAGWPDPWPTEEEVDKFAQLYHVKRGYFVFQDGKKIAFDGSFNETDSGHKHNTETANVYKDWVDRDEFRARNIIEKVDRDWGGKNHDLHIRPLSKELIELIKASAPEKRPRITPTQTEPPQEIPVLNEPQATLPNKVSLRPYQLEALKKWEDNSNKGILAMATGSGKTRTAIEIIQKFRKSYPAGLVVIVVPYKVLATQWIKEINDIASIAAISAFDIYTEWFNPLKNWTHLATLKSIDAPCIVAVNKTFKSDKFQGLLKEVEAAKEKNHLIIVDECHHFNDLKSINLLPKHFGYRLGLSATPYDQFEDNPEDRYLEQFFSKVVFEYTLNEAITAGFLCPYEYQVIEVSLNEEETTDYEDLSKKIGQALARSTNAKQDSSGNLESLLAKRTRLVGIAQDKLIKLEEHVKKTGRQRHVLVYCGDGSNEEDGEKIRQIQQVSKLLSKLNWNVGKITCEESSDQREQTIISLKMAAIDAVVSIQVLDEGVDIPSCEVAYILASKRSERVFIQRRGRVLRLSKDTNKEKAVIYDFVVTGAATNSASVRTLVKNELQRVWHFAKDAINGNEVTSRLDSLAKSVDFFGEKNE